MKKTIVIIDSVNNRYVDKEFNAESESVDDHAILILKEVRSYMDLLDDEEVLSADVIVSWHAIALPKIFIDKLKNCKAIVRPAVGFDNIDIVSARSKNIPVINIPDYGTEEVADHTLSLILSCVRNIVNINLLSKKGVWNWKHIGLETKRLRNCNAGIVGFGRIGKAVALRLKAFGVNVYFYDPYEKSGIDKSLGVIEVETIEALFEKSQIITVHVPLNNETKKLINSKNISHLQKDAILVNTSRGEVIDQKTLIEFLSENPDFRLGLDVLENEPEIPLDLINNDNVILTSHSAFYSTASLKELKQKSIITAVSVLSGKSQKNIIN